MVGWRWGTEEGRAWVWRQKAPASESGRYMERSLQAGRGGLGSMTERGAGPFVPLCELKPSAYITRENGWVTLS
jgi:hypothetical protein